MSDQDEPIPHAVNNDWAGGVRKTMTQSSTAAELQFAMVTKNLFRLRGKKQPSDGGFGARGV
jgi:hypothetical protein